MPDKTLARVSVTELQVDDVTVSYGRVKNVVTLMDGTILAVFDSNHVGRWAPTDTLYIESDAAVA